MIKDDFGVKHDSFDALGGDDYYASLTEKEIDAVPKVEVKLEEEEK